MVRYGLSPKARAERIAELDRRAEREAERRRFRERPPLSATRRHEAAHALAAVEFDFPIDGIEVHAQGGIMHLADGGIATRAEAVRRVALCLCGPAFDGEEPQSNVAVWVGGEPGDLDIAVQIADRYGEDIEDGKRLLAEGRALANRLVADGEFRAKGEFLALELAERHYIAGPAVEWLLRSEVAATC